MKSKQKPAEVSQNNEGLTRDQELLEDLAIIEKLFEADFDVRRTIVVGEDDTPIH